MEVKIVRIQNQSWMAFANNRIQKNQASIVKTLEKVSGGDKITRAADNASGLSISETMRAQIKGLSRAQQNTQDGLSVLEVTDSGLQSVNNVLHRVRELVVQAANDTLTNDDRELAQKEVTQLMSSIDDTAKNMEFNTQKILGEIRPLYIQTGANGSQSLAIDTYDVRTKVLGLENASIQTSKGANDLIMKVDNATSIISSHLAQVGADYNSLTMHNENIKRTQESIQKTESLIRDPDLALEIIDYVKQGITQKGSELLILSVNRDTKSLLNLFN